MGLGFSGNQRLCEAIMAAACLLMAGGAAPAEHTLAGYSPVEVSGEPANRINVIFIGEGFSQAEIDTLWPEKVDESMYFFRNVEPYKRYRKFFNYYRVNLISPESGCDVPHLGIIKDTALDALVNQYARFWMDWDKADQIIAEALAGTTITPDVTPCPINTDQPGANETTGYAMYAVGGGQGPDVVIHEVGHSWNRLGDEYDDTNPDVVTTYTGTESFFDKRANVTTDPAGTKWAEWIGYTDPLYPSLGPIGVFEGAAAYDKGVYRPCNNSKMKTPSRAFNAVCREKIIQDLYSKVRPLDAHLSDAAPLTDPRDLWVQLVDPDILRVQWFINDVLVPGLGDPGFRVSDLDLTPGTYTIRARAHDPTDWVRRQLELLEQSVTWTVDLTFTAHRPAWQRRDQAVTTNPLYGVWGSGPADLFVAGSAGTMLHYDGSTWQAMASGTSNPLYGVWGSASTNVMAVGSTGTVIRYNGTTWTPMPPATSAVQRPHLAADGQQHDRGRAGLSWNRGNRSERLPQG